MNIPTRSRLNLEVVDHEEYVGIDEARVTVVEGTRTAFLHLRTPGGDVVRAEIDHRDLDRLLAQMWPEDFDGGG